MIYNAYEVGEKLAKIREENGYSQEGLAETLGCSAITISRWENGHTHMKDEDVTKVCLTLGISADCLLGLPIKTEMELLKGLTEQERNIVLETMKVMVAAIKANRSDK